VRADAKLLGNKGVSEILEFKPLTETLAKICKRLSLRQKNPNHLGGGTEITCKPLQPDQSPVVLQVASQLPPDQRAPLETPWTLSLIQGNKDEQSEVTQNDSMGVVLLQGAFQVDPIGQIQPVVQKVFKERLLGFDVTAIASLLFEEFARLRDVVVGECSEFTGLEGFSVPCTLDPCMSAQSLGKISIMSLVVSTLQGRKAKEGLKVGDSQVFYENATGSLKSFVYSVKVARVALKSVCAQTKSKSIKSDSQKKYYE
jgi:hypothetical protein